MPLTLKERSLFLERSAAVFETHQDWARSLGKIIPYRLQDFRDLIERRLEENRCPYCPGQLTAASFCPAHKVPIARNGRFNLKNLEVCCPACHSAKGILDSAEFKELLAVVRTWPKPVVKNFLARLQAGTALVSAGLPRVGSLEWFTGSDAPLPQASIRANPSPTPEQTHLKSETNHESHHDQPALGHAPGHRGQQV